MVSATLTAIGRDYKQTTGRDLTIRSARRGSLYIDLEDAALVALASAGAIVTMRDYFKLFIDLFTRAKATRGSLGSGRGRGARTVRAIIDAARASHSDIEMVYDGPSDRLVVRMTRAEAEEMHELAQPEGPQERLLRAPPPVRHDVVAREIEGWAISAIEDRSATGPDSSDNASFHLLRIIVRALKEEAGGPDRLARISQRLRATGNASAADLVDRISKE